MVEVCPDQWLGPVSGEHLVSPPVTGECVRIVPSTVHEGRKGNGRRVYGGQAVSQAPGRGDRTLGSKVRLREIEQGTRSSGADARGAGAWRAVVSRVVVDESRIVHVSGGDRKTHAVAAAVDAAFVPQATVDGIVIRV
ncbi:hypothetical protein ACH4VM_30960 [Streptomyces sp. NPDC020792]|uniref:hypothetical protein n=1 Tax=Streptomyces sp. NPDC020792 TaxID=3365089 RepID=UPI0037A44B35